MEPLRRIHRLWNWLPAFRAVAETEHLPTASEMLAVSPSALSRSIKLIEDDIGEPLFEREGRALRLNEAGQVFLAAVREAMRRVHDGIGEIDRSRFIGSLQIGSAGLMNTAFVPELIGTLRRDHPDLLPTVTNVSVVEETMHLLTGRVDVSFTSWGQRHDATELVVLGRAPNGVWCGPGHALHGRERVDIAEMLEHEFAGPLPDEHGRTREGWPPEHARKISVHTQTMHMGLELCARGGHLAVLPDVVAHARGDLWRLPFDALPSTPLFARKRVQVGPPGKAELCIEAMQAVVAAAVPPADQNDAEL